MPEHDGNTDTTAASRSATFTEDGMGEATLGFWLRTTLDLLLGGNFQRSGAGNRMQMKRLKRLRLFQPLLPAPQRWVRKHDRRRNA